MAKLLYVCVYVCMCAYNIICCLYYIILYIYIFVTWSLGKSINGKQISVMQTGNNKFCRICFEFCVFR